MRYGHTGRTLSVDLTNGTFTDEQITDKEWRRYVGGSLMGVVHLLRQTRPDLDPYDPKMLFMLWSSVVSGQPYVGLARCCFVAKSPLTGGIGEARVEGPFGVALKASGFDGLIFQGCSDLPRYLLLEDGVPTLHDASSVWGLDTGETTRRLRETHGNDAQVATIGVSGERRVRFAGIVTSQRHVAARMGMGAVMGSKNLKAIVLKGGVLPDVYDSVELERITADYSTRMERNVLTKAQFDAPGFGALITAGADITGYVGTQNYRGSRLPTVPAGTRTQLIDRLIADASVGACPGCPNDCIKTFRNTVDDETGSLDEETLVAFAFGLGITDVDPLLNLNAKCHLWGVDPVSLSFALSMVMEAANDGVPAATSLSLPIPSFGQTEEIIHAIERVATRVPEAALLADGTKRAVARLGPSMSPYAMEVKGQEMVYFDPRASAGQALAYAVSPLGPRYDIVEHDIDFDPTHGYPHGLDQMRALGVLGMEPMGQLDDRRVARTSTLLNLWSGLDALGICLFAGPPLRGLDLATVAKLVAAVTGWRMSDDEVFTWGRRRWQLMRIYNLREGLAADQDMLPDRFFDTPVDHGEHEGSKLDRSSFARALALYYRVNGWDPGGEPTPEVLLELDLEWATRYLEK